MPKTTTIKRGRDAENGQFVPIEYANKHPKTTVVETIKIKKNDVLPVERGNRDASFLFLFIYM